MDVEIQIDKIKLPINISITDRHFFEKCLFWKYSYPKVKRHYFLFAYPKGYSTSVFLNPIKNIAPWKNFYQSFNKYYFLGELLNSFFKLKVRVELKGKYYYCVNEFSDNYFHWFTEVLPKMLYVKNSLDRNAQFFIPFFLKEYQIDSLAECNIDTYHTDQKTSLFRRVNVVENFTIYPGIYNPELLSGVKKIIIKKNDNKNFSKRKIYITRINSSRRKLLNENALSEILLRYNIEIFDFDKTSFKEQLDIIKHTEILISIHGAALTNMLFMEANSKIIEFLPVELTNDKCYFMLAGALKHDYYYVDCQMNGKSHITSDFFIDLKEFEETLKMALKD
jgi:capsular polysaccharide biosynthesis protein